MTSNGHESGKPLRAGDPRELDGHRIVSRLGRGGMGTVYLAEDPSGRSVAVKLIHPDLADDESFRLRFAREVESARRVARFSTAGVLGARLEGEPLYIVTEYVPGPNLDEAIRSGGPMGGGTLEGLALGVAAALTAIHGSGVVHRDLKPANVLLSPVGPKVIDFGIARALDEAGGGVTRSSQLMGTPSYMAPELLLGEQATAAADIFAWGCLVAFSGTGRAPFDAATVPAVLHNISSAPPRLDGLDPALLDLVRATLDKNPANRPSSQQILARLTGQAEPEEAEVRRTITDSWAPPSGVPVVGAPPQETGAGLAHNGPAGGGAVPRGPATPPGGQPSEAGDPLRPGTAGAHPFQDPHAQQPPVRPVPPTQQVPPDRTPPTRQMPDGRGHPPSGPQPAQGHRAVYPNQPPGRGQNLPGHYPPPGPGGPSLPPHDRRPGTQQANFSGPGGPGGPVGPVAAGARPNPGRRRRTVAIGAAAAAVVLVAAVGGAVLLNGSEEVPPTVSLYEIDFTTDPDWGSVYDPGTEDGYWQEERGYLLQHDPGTSTYVSRGTKAAITTESVLPDRVVVSSTAYVVEGPEQAVFGVRCWDNDGEEYRTHYEALLRYDGRRAEIRRMNEEDGDRTLAETTEVSGFEPYPLFDEEARDGDYDPDRPYVFEADTVPTNTVTLSCQYYGEDAEDGEGERMELSMWVNDEHVLTTVDDTPLPDDGEEAGDRRQVGVVTRPGPGNEPLGVLFTDFYLGEVTEEG
ncbi:protein kinase [Nocardiopsis tropica]|uniref:serine/threonine-protein kinase n=1 Tax=Nocardiopsis tropica TaxID=109330 RepID=UPI0036160DAA